MKDYFAKRVRSDSEFVNKKVLCDFLIKQSKLKPSLTFGTLSLALVC